jgi:hypothetical protein
MPTFLSIWKVTFRAVPIHRANRLMQSSIESYIEISWIMGCIKHSTADSKVDLCMLDGLTVKLEPVDDKEVKCRYGKISCLMLVSVLLASANTAPFCPNLSAFRT